MDVIIADSTPANLAKSLLPLNVTIAPIGTVAPTTDR